MRKYLTLAGCLFFVFLQTGIGSENHYQILSPDLTKIAGQEGWTLKNRKIITTPLPTSGEIKFNAELINGCAWFEELAFFNGIIECEVKGRTLQGASFVGIAFRGEDEENYDAVYFRPFNFRSPDDLRRAHSVQYISHPLYTWRYLRTAFPGKYENSLINPPDPEQFFHIKIVLKDSKITVFFNRSETPCLEITSITPRKKGKIGLWMGYGSDGSFKNLKIINKD